MVVIAGGATLAGSARVQGNVVVLGGTVEVEEGATVQRDLVVLGGGLEVPPASNRAENRYRSGHSLPEECWPK